MSRAYSGWSKQVKTRLAIIAAGATALVASLTGCQSVRELELPSLSSKPAVVGPATTVYRQEPDIRVRVNKGVSSTVISGPPRVILRKAGVGAGTPEYVATPITVTSGSKGVRIVDGQKRTREWGFGNDMEVVVGDGTADGYPRTPEQSIRVDKTPYPGFITIRPSWSTNAGAFDVIVTMGVESYIPGVLTHELFKDWPRQTYEAQAVAARTYALHERWRARNENRAFDVEDTTADQVYGGMTTASKALEAARVTRGHVITEDGQLVRSYYSSTCGGRPASAVGAWAEDEAKPFNKAQSLQGKPREHGCQKATFYRWTQTRSDDDVSRRMRVWGRVNKHEIAEVGRVRQIQVAEVNDADRPNIYRVTDETGKRYPMTAEELRMSVNQPIPDAMPMTPENRVHSGDTEVSIYGSQVTFTGRGWGHGIGMCQWCAKGFADLGWDWRKMIRTFYPGSEVQKVY